MKKKKQLKITRFEFGPLLKVRGSLEFVNQWLSIGKRCPKCSLKSFVSKNINIINFLAYFVTSFLKD